MKKFLVVALFVFGSFMLVSCGGDDSSSSSGGGSTYCEDSGESNCQYKACGRSDGTAYYEYNGKNYECKGSGKNIDCNDAAMKLYQDCGAF